jgi:hypothetical protein
MRSLSGKTVMPSQVWFAHTAMLVKRISVPIQRFVSPSVKKSSAGMTDVVAVVVLVLMSRFAQRLVFAVHLVGM